MSNHTSLYTSLTKLGHDQASSIRTAAGAVAAAILSSASPVDEMRALFTEARKPYLSAKADKAEAEAVLWSNGWGAITRGLWYHFDKADMKPTWPNFRSGNGDCSLESKAEAKEAAKLARETKAEAEAVAVAQYREDQKRSQLEAWASLSMLEQTNQLVNMIRASGRTVDLIDDLTTALAQIKAEAVAKLEADNAKLAKAAAKAEAAKAAKLAKAAAKAEKVGLVRREPQAEKLAA